MKYLQYLLLLAVIGGGFVYWLWNKPHENMERADADIAIAATTLFDQFNEDETAANTAYLDKVIAVSGQVSSSSKNEDGQVKVTIQSSDEMFGIICELDPLTTHQRTEFTPGETVTMKGKCTGKLMDVVLVRCVEVTE